LGVAGIMRIFDGIWAFRYKGAVPDHLQNALLGTTLKNYGWLWLIVGILLILCALGVMARSQISRWIGVFAGAVIAISAIWWMPYYPIWSLTYIGIGVLVIYALVAEGGRQPVTQ
jgi:asparagine N-glycosylation enzyme membrane subunit Stt3